MAKDSIFINCPFDNDYFSLLKPLLFTLVYIEFTPFISETSNSGQVRLGKISNLISDSKYSIHDLSRMEPLMPGDLPRFNMPFECGIEFGMKFSNYKNVANKKILILEKEKYRYQQVISDISGNDIKAHSNKPEMIIKVVRDWLKQSNNGTPKYKEIWLAFNEFEYDYIDILTSDGYDPYDINSITFCDVIEIMENWITTYKS